MEESGECQGGSASPELSLGSKWDLAVLRWDWAVVRQKPSWARLWGGRAASQEACGQEGHGGTLGAEVVWARLLWTLNSRPGNCDFSRSADVMGGFYEEDRIRHNRKLVCWGFFLLLRVTYFCTHLFLTSLWRSRGRDHVWIRFVLQHGTACCVTCGQDCDWRGT